MKRSLLAFVLVAFAAVGCGGGDDDSSPAAASSGDVATFCQPSEVTSAADLVTFADALEANAPAEVADEASVVAASARRVAGADDVGDAVAASAEDDKVKSATASLTTYCASKGYGTVSRGDACANSPWPVGCAPSEPSGEWWR